MRRFVRAAAFLTAVIIVACAEETPPPPPPGAIPAGQSIGTAVISGRALFDGQPPVPEPIDMSSESGCRAPGGASPVHEAVVLNPDGTLRNVFVRVLSGLGSRVFAPPAQPAVIDQKGCLYRPHVVGVQVAQLLEIVNSDPMLHNVHSVPQANRVFNIAMPSQGMRIRKFFTVPEVMVRFKCDIHSWMNAWIGAVDHPFFAVTGDGGSFNLAGLPAGSYEIEAWHETLGRKQATVSVGDGETKEIDFSFGP